MSFRGADFVIFGDKLHTKQINMGVILIFSFNSQKANHFPPKMSFNERIVCNISSTNVEDMMGVKVDVSL